MPNTIPTSTLEQFTTFGDLLRFLRRRAGITQLELSIAVGYSASQISRLEQNLRLPDLPTIEARFVPSLYLEEEPIAIARLMELAAAVSREDAPALGLCPYKGLDYFDEADADLFVGRESLTEKLKGQLLLLASKEQAHMGRFFAIVGASGSGKSSLVRAGLVPALRWDKASTNWQIHVLTPSTHPLENLANTLTRESSLTATAALMDDLAGDTRSLSLFIKRERKTTIGLYLLLVIDQFEELFTLCHSETERLAFINNLLTAACVEDGQAIIIIILRADFYAHCAQYLNLRQALAAHQEYIGAMNDNEIRRAIEEPAQRWHWKFEPGLVDLILRDVGHEPGALPLLSHALLETWQRRHGRVLTLSGYTSSGGVRGAIAETAEAVFTDQFTSEQQAIARRIFLRLTELGDETAIGDTRRRVTISELIRKPEEADATQVVLKALADARLVTTSENTVQVAHEALIREWPTLRGWLEDNREGLRLHRQLTESTQEWLAGDREPDMLFRGARLAQAREWSASHEEDLNAQEQEFLAAAVTASEREATERDAQYQRELRAAQKLADTERQRAEGEVKSARRLRRRSIIVSIVSTLAILLAVFGIFAYGQSTSNAAYSQSLSLADAALQANQSGRGDLALKLALEAIQMKQPPLDALKALRTIALDSGTRAVLNGHNQSVRAVAISPDTQSAFSASCAQVDIQGACQTGELILWDLNSSKELRRWSGHRGWVNAVAISLDGQLLTSGAEDGSLLVWDKNGHQIRQLVGHTGSITGLAIVSVTGSLLSSSADGSLILWELRNGENLMQYGPISSPIRAISVAAKSAIAVSAHQDGSLMIWSLYKSQPIGILENQGADIASVALSPDGSWILLTNQTTPDLFLRKIDSQTGKVLNQQLFGCIPDNLAISPDVTYALVACQNEIYQLDIQNWSVQRHFVESPDLINAIAISRDGLLGISASQDGTLRVWNLGSQLNYRVNNINADIFNAIAVSPDGKYLLLNDVFNDGYVRPALWDVAARRVYHTYSGFYGIFSSGALAISPNRRIFAGAGWEFDPNVPSRIKPVVAVWSLDYPDITCRFDGLKAKGRAIAISTDSQYLLVGSQDEKDKTGQLVLLDAQTCNPIRQFDTDQDVTSIAFNTDGTRAVTGTGYYGRVILWDVTSGKEIRRFSYNDFGPVMGVAFGPDGSTILGSGSADLYLWDIATGNISQRYTGHTTAPWSLVISSDGKYVLSSAMDGDVILWDFATGEELYRWKLYPGVYCVSLSLDGRVAYAATLDSKLVEFQVSVKSLPELRDWIASNRYLRELTTVEKQQYHVKP